MLKLFSMARNITGFRGFFIISVCGMAILSFADLKLPISIIEPGSRLHMISSYLMHNPVLDEDEMNTVPAWLPMLGDINNFHFNHAPDMNSKEFGKSAHAPLITEITVSDEESIPGNVGQKVHNTYFPDYPEFIFNVSFACAASNPFVKNSALYTDPNSIWFNVFFGYYEIDAPLSKWDRPFGYIEKDGKLVPYVEDSIRIAKADWNYFSNYMYGVPEESIEPCNTIDHDEITIVDHTKRKKIGDKYWDVVELDDLEVVSAYYTEEDDEKIVDNSVLFSPLWRISFGGSNPDKNHKKSFFPVKMGLKFYMTYKIEYDEDLGEMAYKTFFFGGTKNGLFPDRAASDRFREEQLKTIRKLIVSHFPDLGFNSE
ncbi:MAG: hypothetical protein GY754_34360 [bacterium]|nr:hypothetical protein [bacterium]